MHFLRFFFFSLPLIGVLTIVWPAASLLLWIFGGSTDHQFQLGRLWARGLLNLSFIRVRYTGLESFNGLGPCVLVANHPSPLDVTVLLYGIPASFRIFSMGRLFFHPFLCIQLRTGNHIPVGGKSAQDLTRSVRLGIRSIAKTGRGILVFPEISNLVTELQLFQEGAAFMAIKAGVPIVPMALTGTRQFLGGTVTVRVGEPIRTVGLRVSDRAWLTTCLHGRVSELLSMDGAMASNSSRF
jgi:1-acyl-sn-glycerol-3-phosphate acyltransferase